MKMKTLKKILITCLISLIPYIFFYLCISFVHADFNFANWSWNAREVLVVASTLCSIFALSFYFSPTQNELNNFYK